MSTYNITLTQKARQDMLNIKYYIKYMLLSSQAAEAEVTLSLFYKKFDQIAKNPYLYPCDNFGKHSYHMAVVKKYIIAFRIDENTHTVYIVAIGHSLRKRKNIVK